VGVGNDLGFRVGRGTLGAVAYIATDAMVKINGQMERGWEIQRVGGEELCRSRIGLLRSVVPGPAL